MNVRSLIGNAGVAFLAQGITFVISCLTSLLVPKLLGVAEYGYWQLFTFYASYVGFFHLGLNDGVYLVNGGKSRDVIDKRSVNSQFVMGAAVQTLMALVVVAGTLLLDLEGERSFVIMATAVYMVEKNAALYLGYVFQAMNETKKYSFSCILERVVFFVPLVVLLAVGNTRFEPYVVAYCVSAACQLAYCLWFARDFVASGLEPLGLAATECVESIRVGIKLMLANIASQLVLGVARFVIDAVWGIETFGKLSLSLSMVNFALTFVTQAAMVLFPALRQSSEREIRSFVHYARDTMGLVFPAVYLLYYPAVWILSLWLPEYADSFVFLAYLLPICVFDSKMNIACTTYFKVNRDEAELFRINLVTTLVSAAGTLLGAYVVGSVYVVIGSVVVAIIGRSVWSEHVVASKLGIGVDMRITAGELLVTLIFVAGAAALPDGLALVLYAAAYVAFLVVNRSTLRDILGKARKVGRS